MIGTLTSQDVDACAALYVETFNALPWNESWRVADARQRLADFLATPRAHGVLVRGARGNLLGFALGALERSESQDAFLLKEMCVRAEAQRQGIGSALLEALAAQMPEVRHWYLLTARDSEASAFYGRNGFRPSERMAVFVRP